MKPRTARAAGPNLCSDALLLTLPVTDPAWRMIAFMHQLDAGSTKHWLPSALPKQRIAGKMVPGRVRPPPGGDRKNESVRRPVSTVHLGP